MKFNLFDRLSLLSLIIIAQPLIYSVSVHAMDASPVHYAHTTRPSQIGAIKQKIIGAYNTTKQWMLNHKLFLSGIGTAIIGYCGYQWLLAPTPPMAPSPAIPPVHDTNSPPTSIELQTLHNNLRDYRGQLRDVRTHIAAYVMSDYQRQDIIELFHHNAPQLPCRNGWFINPLDHRIFIYEDTYPFKRITQWNYVNFKPYFMPDMPIETTARHIDFHSNGSYITRKYDIFNIHDKNNNSLYEINGKDDCIAQEAVWDDIGNNCALMFRSGEKRLNDVIVLNLPTGKTFSLHQSRVSHRFPPAFSPNGKKIAYYDDENNAIVVIDCETQIRQILPYQKITFLDWHTNDTLILTNKSGHESTLTLLKNNNEIVNQFSVKNLFEIILSPDRKKVALITKDKFFLLNLETGTTATLTDNKNHLKPFHNRRLSVLKWSLDNSLLAIFQGYQESKLQIYDASTSQVKYEFAIENPFQETTSWQGFESHNVGTHYKLFWTIDNKLAYGLNTSSYIDYGIDSSIRLLDIPALDRLMDSFDKKNKNPITLNALLYAKLQQQTVRAAEPELACPR